MKNKGKTLVQKDTPKNTLPIERITTMAVSGLMFAIMAFLSIVSFVSTSNIINDETEVVLYLKDNVAINIIVLVFMFMLLYLIFPYLLKIPLKWIKWGLFCLVIIIGAIWIVSAKIYPCTDAEVVSTASYLFSSNNYEILDCNAYPAFFYTYLDYFKLFPYQLGYIFFNEIVLRIFRFNSNPFILLQFLNLFFLAGIYFFLINIINELFNNEKIAKVTGILLLLCPQPIFICTNIYGSLPGLFFSILSIWLLLKYFSNGKIFFAIISMFFIAVAVVIKLNYLIFLVAICIVLVYRLIVSISEKNIRRTLVLCGYIVFSFILSSLLLQSIISSYERRFNEKLGKGVPMISWMVTGSSDSPAAPGWFNWEHMNIFYEAEENNTQAAKLSIEKIKERCNYFCKNPKIACVFFYKKMVSQWNETTYESIWKNQLSGANYYALGIAKLVCVTGEKQSKKYIDFISQFIYVMALICAIGFLIVNKQRNINQALFFIIIIGGFLYHLLFEAKSEYSLPYFILLIPLAAAGFCQAYEFINGKLRKKLDKS